MYQNLFRILKPQKLSDYENWLLAKKIWKIMNKVEIHEHVR